MIRRTFLLGAAMLALGLGAACTDDEPEPQETETATATDTATETTEATTTATVTGTTLPTATETATEAPATSTATGTATPTEDPLGDACFAVSPEVSEMSFVIVTNVSSGDTIPSGTIVEGCSRTFESNVPWRLVDREGNVLAEGATMGGGVDGRASFEFEVTYTVSEVELGHLFVGGDDPSDGEGFPPSTNQIPVELIPGGGS